ncbi:NAD(P)-dependent alcohol dehydrogenase [Cocleimonas flava]|uniref:NADPH:quinone reductase-like Zn-dependent oxidoreductase n=1 Tax=Cocleimonas flava TaxID=634765 RepID=A0A4R1EYU7_9GAMM|nr:MULTISPECIES: NAD(P)-dependent alcohol dehydrogenase [Cocleimonas]MEB8432785.1 NAD(P)-dependent alcohol dehydrogenase [Cocleimonas sp. KMM 6892]MEC4715644.1 NAD(P)-dependent alcohol dehydrogenase [Cocleimonas sp. KMM 6895]MEC4744738.1 NAD(P)-dependent alcohol dehydrogenase [Cocleimonas sp. KMM 6896]TCJ83211.1 NADPH:quinone reductase-like Zn-dependent oxidoreductase [Cocleimonas flava]
MKAVTYSGYGSPAVIRVSEVEKPTPKANEVLVKVWATSITTADSMIREGKPCYGRLFLGLAKHKHPISGTGFSGEVEEIGRSVTQFKMGDKVFGETGVNFSANAEYICIAEDAVISILPDNLSHEEAAPICDGALTSYAFLKDIGQLKRGQSILINGASGSLGSAAVQIAKALGAEVTGVCSRANVELVQSLGADKVIDYHEEDFTKMGNSYDLVYDAVGKSSFCECRKNLKEQGAYLSPVLSFPLLIQMMWTSTFMSKKARFSATGLRPAKELRVMIDELIPLYKSGEIKSVIDRTYSLAETADAHRYIETGRKKGNVVVSLII